MSISNNIHISKHFTQQPASSPQHAQHAQHAQLIKNEIISQRHVEEGTSPRSNQFPPCIIKSLYDVDSASPISLSKDKPQSLNEIFNAANECINKFDNSPQDESFKTQKPVLKYSWNAASHSQEKGEVYFRKHGDNKVFHCKVENHSDLILPEHFKNNITSKAQKAIDEFIAERNLTKKPGCDLYFNFVCKKTNTDGEIKISPKFSQKVQGDEEKSSHGAINMRLEPFTISLNSEAVGGTILPPKQFQDLMRKAEKALTEEKYTIETETKEAEKVPDAKDIAIKNKDNDIKKQIKTIEELRTKLADLEKKNCESEDKLKSDAEKIKKLSDQLQNITRENEDKLKSDAEKIKKLSDQLQNITRENEMFLKCEKKINDELSMQTKEIGELKTELLKSNIHPVLRPIAESLGMTLGGIILVFAASPAFLDAIKTIIYDNNSQTVDNKEASGDYDEIGNNAYNLALQNQVNSDKETYYALQEKEDLNGSLSVDEQKEKERLSQYYSQNGSNPNFSVDSILPEFIDDPHFTEPANQARTSTIATQKSEDLKVMNQASDNTFDKISDKLKKLLPAFGAPLLALGGSKLAKTLAHNLPINLSILSEKKAAKENADSPYKHGEYIKMNMGIHETVNKGHQKLYGFKPDFA